MIVSNRVIPEKIGCFIFFYLAIFGPKIGSFIDISLFSNSFVFLICSGMNLKLYLKVRPILLGIISLIAYSLLVALFCQTIDYLFVFKFIRALISVLAISTFVSTSKLELDEIYNCAATVLLVHAMVVIIGAVIWPRFQIIVRPLSGYIKDLIPLRSTGLTNGFDFSGMLCCFGILVTYFGKKCRLSTIKLLLFIIASIFTSRMSMLIMEGIVFYIVSINRRRNIINKKILTIIFIVSIIPILGIFMFSTQDYDNPIVNLLMKNETFKSQSSQLVNYYASTSIGSTIKDHYNFSELNSIEIIFGSMTEAHQDPGITQYIFEIGIVGLMIAVLSYFGIIVNSFKCRVLNRDLYTIVVLMCFLCLIMSVKNSYLFARHVTECIIVFYSLLTIKTNNSDNQADYYLFERNAYGI